MEKIEFEIVSNVASQIGNVKEWKETIKDAASTVKNLMLDTFNSTKSAARGFMQSINDAGGGLKGMANILKSKIVGAFNSVVGSIKNFGTTFMANMAAAGGGMTGFTVATKAATRSVITFTTALVASGVGAILVGIGVALASLITYFKDTQDGQIAWMKTMNSVQVVIGPLMHSFGELGKAIKELFSFNFKKAGAALVESMTSFNKSVKANAKDLKALNDLEEKLVTQRQDASEKEKQLQTDIAELRDKANDSERYTAEQRQKFVDAAIAKTKELGTIRKKLAENELELENKKASQGDNNIADNEKLVELRNKVRDADAKMSSELRNLHRLQKRTNTEIKNNGIKEYTDQLSTMAKTYTTNEKVFAKVIENTDTTISKRKDKLKDLQAYSASYYKQQIALISKATGKDIDSQALIQETTAMGLKKRIDAMGIKGTLAQAIIKAVDFEKNQKMKLANYQEKLNKDIEKKQKDHNEAMKSANQEIREDTINQMEDGLEKEKAKLNESLRQKKETILNNTNLTKEEQESQILYWTNSTNNKISDLTNKFDEQEKEKEKERKEKQLQAEQDFQLKLNKLKNAPISGEDEGLSEDEKREMRLEKDLEAEQERSDTLMAQILANTSLTEQERSNLEAQLLEQTENRKDAIRANHRRKNAAEDRRSAANAAGDAMAFGAQVANFAAEVSSGDAETQKALNIAGAVMNTAAGVAKAIGQTGALSPFVIPSIIAAGAIQVAKIEATPLPKPKKYALGGLITGASHISGGVGVEAEGGEFIVNKRAMSNPDTANAVKALNAGQAPSNNTQDLNAIVRAIQDLNVFVSVQDIQTGLNKVEVTQDRFSV